jgi:hypothetical protein
LDMHLPTIGYDITQFNTYVKEVVMSSLARGEITQDLATMRAFLSLISALLRCALGFFRNRNEQAIVELELRQQLATYAQKRTRLALSPLDRAFWVALFRFWPGWKDTLVIVKPDTVIRWPRKGFRL